MGGRRRSPTRCGASSEGSPSKRRRGSLLACTLQTLLDNAVSRQISQCSDFWTASSLTASMCGLVIVEWLSGFVFTAQGLEGIFAGWTWNFDRRPRLHDLMVSLILLQMANWWPLTVWHVTVSAIPSWYWCVDLRILIYCNAPDFSIWSFEYLFLLHSYRILRFENTTFSTAHR